MITKKNTLKITMSRPKQNDDELTQLTEYYSSFENEELNMPIKEEPQPEFEEIKYHSTESKRVNRTEDQQRLLNAYYKEISNESIFNRKEEIGFSVKINKCLEKTKQLKAILDTLSKDCHEKTDKIELKNYREQDIEKQIKIFNGLIKAYSQKARQFRERFIKANLKLVLFIANKHRGLGLQLSDIIQEGNM
ncbi:hypothetical protein MYX76_17745, partial [Desulfobacterota bacterium AH_259_B03_O07]|nr:hypothetical protein [Desulfobacterota bacterium AH_259_B03_O07]